MALTLPYPTYSAFVPATVHSDTDHNTPHAGLLSNDVAIKAFVDSLESTVSSLSSSISSIVSSILYTQNALFSATLSLTSTGTWVVFCNASSHSSQVLPYTLTMDGSVIQTLSSLGDLPGTSYNPFFGIVTKAVTSAPYSFTCTISSTPAVYANSGRVAIIAFKISS